jgi:hypothetical protein
MASIVTWIVFIVRSHLSLRGKEADEQQVVIGIFLKLHIMEKTIRRYIVPIHSILGKIFPLIGWTRMYPYKLCFNVDVCWTDIRNVNGRRYSPQLLQRR